MAGLAMWRIFGAPTMNMTCSTSGSADEVLDLHALERDHLVGLGCVTQRGSHRLDWVGVLGQLRDGGLDPVVTPVFALTTSTRSTVGQHGHDEGWCPQASTVTMRPDLSHT